MMKKNLVSSPSNSLFRMYPSINNMFMLGIVLFSVFLVYRYVKSLEKEVKVLADKINTIQYKPQSVEPIMFQDENMMNKECDSNGVCMMNNNGSGVNVASHTDDDDDDDDDSVKSEDIMKMIDHIQNEVVEESEAPKLHNHEQKDSVENKIEPLTTIKESMEHQNTENKEEEGVVLEDDDFVIKKSNLESGVLDVDGISEESLLKKTNDDLRKILKDQGKNTKGLKNDLIKRILEE
jgi:hypothetical protein